MVTHPGLWQPLSRGFAAMAVVIDHHRRAPEPSDVLFEDFACATHLDDRAVQGGSCWESPEPGIPGAQGLPWPELSLLLTPGLVILVPGLVIAVVGLAETTSTSARRLRPRIRCPGTRTDS